MRGLVRFDAQIAMAGTIAMRRLTHDSNTL